MSTNPTAAADISAAVVASFAHCQTFRLRELMQALTEHLHAFAREVRLTEAEWEDAIRVLTETGQITDERRQEFVLLSDALGLSMLVDAIAHEAPAAATESTVRGPFWVPESPPREYGESIIEQAAGTPAWVHGRVLDTSGRAIAAALLDVWQNGENRLYAVQDSEAPETHLRGQFTSREDGSYAFLGVRPTPYPIPDDGPVGRMLAATGRHPWRPAHLHVIVSAPGYRKLTTHIFDAASEYLDSDAVFAVKPSLIRRFVARDADDPERPPGVTGEWCSVENDFGARASRLIIDGVGYLAADPVNQQRGAAMPQAKADRSAAAKKGAATRKRNQAKAKSQTAGKKAAGTRQGRAATETAGQAKRAAGSVVSGAKSAARSAGTAAKQAGKAAATRAGAARSAPKKKKK